MMLLYGIYALYQPAVIVIAGIVLSIVVAFVSRTIFINIEDENNVEMTGIESLA